MAQQLDDYVIHRRLAQALFGDVLLCEHKPTAQRVAVKRVLLSAAAARRTVATKKRVRENVALERELYRRFALRGGHENVLALREEIEFDGYLYLIFEYCARGELYDLVSSVDDGKLDAATARNYLVQIARGVQFMHANGFAHRDLSLENVLVTDDNIAKICDFGLVAPANKPTSETVGKMFYMAPEVLASAVYDPKKADVWSLGIMLFIMLIGAPPVEAASPTDARFRVIQSKGVRRLIQRWGLLDSLPTEAIDLLEQMLVADPAERCTIDQVLSHPFVRGHAAVVKAHSFCGALPTDSAKPAVEAAPPTPTNIRTTPPPAKENRLTSTIQRLFRRASKRRIVAISSGPQQRHSAAIAA